jgi:sulfatase maturation enzyme AslB (radical SAM superfamily)
MARLGDHIRIYEAGVRSGVKIAMDSSGKHNSHANPLPMFRPAAVGIGSKFIFYPKVPPISLELTNRCNLKCPYCANATLTRAGGLIEWSLLEKLVEESSDEKHSIDWLHGTGEPLLWDRLEEVIRLIVSNRAGKASFATNATLLHPRRVEKLLQAGLTGIYISLDSLNQEIYKSTRGGDLEKVVRNVKTMISMVPANFDVTIALMTHKLQQITQSDVALFWETFGADPRIKLNVVETGILPSAREDYRLHPNQQQRCGLPSEYFFITLSGRVALCCADQDLMHPIGDTRTETIDEIWFREENQILFRNVGMGLHPCPQICTKHCHLKEPA